MEMDSSQSKDETPKSPPSPPGPSKRDLISIEVLKRLKNDEQKRERNWRESASNDRPLELDSLDGQNIERLAFALCRPYANARVNIKQMMDVQPKVNAALLGFLREISPSDRKFFFAITEQISCRQIIVPEGRRKVKALMKEKYEDAYEADKRYKDRLLSIDPSHTADRSLRNDRLALELEGRRGLRPDGMNHMRFGYKTMEENDRLMKSMRAFEARNIRRRIAADEYFALWERIEEQGLLPAPAAELVDPMHPRGEQANEQKMHIFRPSKTGITAKMKKEWEERARKEISDPFTDYLTKIRTGPPNPAYSRLMMGGSRSRTPLSKHRENQPCSTSSNPRKIHAVEITEELDSHEESDETIEVLLEEESTKELESKRMEMLNEEVIEDAEPVIAMDYEEATGVEDAFEGLEVADSIDPADPYTLDEPLAPLPPISIPSIPSEPSTSYTDKQLDLNPVCDEPITVVMTDEDEEIIVVDDEPVKEIELEIIEEKTIETGSSKHSGMDAPSTSAQPLPIEDPMKNEAKKKPRRKKKRPQPVTAANDEETKMLLAAFLVDFSQGSSRDSSVTRSQSSSSSSPTQISVPAQPSPLIGTASVSSSSSSTITEDAVPDTAQTSHSIASPTAVPPSLPVTGHESPSSLSDHDYTRLSIESAPSSLQSSPLPPIDSLNATASTSNPKSARVRTATEPSSSSWSTPTDVDYSKNLEYMNYEAPRNSAAAKALQRLTNRAIRTNTEEDWDAATHERKRHDQLFYAISVWPKEKFPIKGLHPYEDFTRDRAIKFLGLRSMADPIGENFGDFSVKKLDQLHVLKNSVKEPAKNERDKNKTAEDTTEKVPPPIRFRPASTSQPQPHKLLPASPPKSSSSIVLSEPTRTSPIPEEMDESLGTSGDNLEEESLLSPITRESQPSSPIASEFVPSTSIPMESPLTSPIPTESPLISPIPIEHSEKEGELSRGSSMESERKRKISDEENSEGEPETKRRERNEDNGNVVVDLADSHLAETMETVESRNDDGDKMDSGHLPIDEITIDDEEGDVDEVQEVEGEPILEDYGCEIIDVRPTSYVLSNPIEDNEEEMIKQEPPLESTGHVVSIFMCPVTVDFEREGSSAPSEFVAPDPRELNYYLPYREATPTGNEEDKKEDPAIVAAREAIERGEGLTGEEGGIVGGRSGLMKRINIIKNTRYKLLIYLLKGRYDDDLLASQRHLRHFADMIQNKLVSPLREENPKEWSHQFYKVVRSDLISSTLYQAVPRTFENDLLLLKPSQEFEEWRADRECDEELLKDALYADKTKFRSLISKTISLKDSFAIARTQSMFRKLKTDLGIAFNDLSVGTEYGSDEYESLKDELTNHVRILYVFSFYTITHSIGINDGSRQPLRPYELLRILAYMLEGWVGWMERGGLIRLFIIACEKREKEGGYVPKGKETALKIIDRIEARVSLICRPLRLIEDEGEERAVLFMLNHLKEKEILTESTRSFKNNDLNGNSIRCGHNLGNAKTTCTLQFKTEEEKDSHQKVAHLWRNATNNAVIQCKKCPRYFLMDISLDLHRLVAHHDYFEEDEEEEEGEGEEGNEGDTATEEDEPRVKDRKKIEKISANLINDYKQTMVEWFPEEREVKQEEESPTKNGAQAMEE